MKKKNKGAFFIFFIYLCEMWVQMKGSEMKVLESRGIYLKPAVPLKIEV